MRPPRVPQAVFSVSALTHRIKTLLAAKIPVCWVQGELSELQLQSSGHAYFTLKDARARLSCVLFKGDLNKQYLSLPKGAKVVVLGELNVYEPRGTYQLVARCILQEGQGPRQQALEALKTKLREEGLFDPKTKRPLPAHPRHIALITSPTGAAVHDFISTLKTQGWHGRLTLFPSQVQGAEAAEQLTAALQLAEKSRLLPCCPQLIVLSRGGGSAEDLQSFNEEPLLRAMAACKIPILSAIGHEVDHTLADAVADARASTPSSAAERVAKASRQLHQRLEQCQRRFQDAFWGSFQRSRNHVHLTAQALRLCTPAQRLLRGQLALNALRAHQANALQARLYQAQSRLELLRLSLEAQVPLHRMARLRQKLRELQKCSARGSLAIGKQAHGRLESLRGRLESVSFQNTLKRGFLIARDARGKILETRASIPKDKKLLLEFQDGLIPAVAQDAKPKKAMGAPAQK